MIKNIFIDQLFNLVKVIQLQNVYLVTLKLVSIEIIQVCIYLKQNIYLPSDIVIIQRMNHTSFSMQNILNEPLNPQLCKKILQQIKSPLLQQSFALTNDQSISNSYINPPRRPNIPPPQNNLFQYTRRPAIKNKYNNTFGNTYNSQNNNYYEEGSYYVQNSRTWNGSPTRGVYDTNRNLGYETAHNFASSKNNNRTFKNVHNNNQNKAQSVYYNQIERGVAYEAIGSIVSPLDPNITLKQENNLKDEGIFQNLCGNLLNTLNNDRQDQIQFDSYGYGKKFQRKKIFNKSIQDPNSQKSRLSPKDGNNNFVQKQKRIQSILLMPQPSNSHISIKQNLQKIPQKSLKQILQQLRKNHHLEIADFVQTICKILDNLAKAQRQRKYLVQNIQMLYQLMQEDNGVKYNQVFGLEDNNYRSFLSRMNFTSVFDMVKKISRMKLIKSSKNSSNATKQYYSDKNHVKQSFQSMLSSFSLIQTLIQQFVRDQHSLQNIRIVYSILKQKFTSLSKTKNTYQQLINLFKDIRLTHLYDQKALMQLEYLWDNFMDGILSQQEFSHGFFKNNAVLCKHNAKRSDSNGQKFETELQKMGFIRN